MRYGLVFGASLVAVACGASIVACGSSTSRDQFDVPPAPDAGFQGDPPLKNGPTACSGLECKVAKCDGDATTTLTGKVYDPAGANPLYNVMVYIPGGPNGDKPLEDFPAFGEPVQCSTCASVAIDPMRSTLTDEKGEFELKNVPVDHDIPIVVQIGKWRRKTTIDVTKKCVENKAPDKSLRLPKNGTEGDLPHIAVTAGGCDALECLLRGIGVDDSEFVAGDDPKGHVHVFAGSGGKGVSGSPPAGGSTTDKMGGFLWNDTAKLQVYDMVMLSCECSEYNENKGGDTASPKSPAIFEYANMGGRVFATHYHYTWFKNSIDPSWKALAKWGGGGFGTSNTYDITQTLVDGSPFPKGVALANWLMAVNASSSLGKIDLEDVTDALSSVNPPAQSWISQGPTSVRYFSFNAPTDADESAQCGRAVYSDLHLMGISAGGQAFPTGCPAPGGLSAQQKALEFMFFDLASCVQGDDQPPVLPQ
jgi:hypothetical protein